MASHEAGQSRKGPISLNLQFRVEARCAVGRVGPTSAHSRAPPLSCPACGEGERGAAPQEMKNVHAYRVFAPIPANAS